MNNCDQQVACCYGVIMGRESVLAPRLIQLDPPFYITHGETDASSELSARFYRQEMIRQRDEFTDGLLLFALVLTAASILAFVGLVIWFERKERHVESRDPVERAGQKRNRSRGDRR